MACSQDYDSDSASEYGDTVVPSISIKDNLLTTIKQCTQNYWTEIVRCINPMERLEYFAKQNKNGETILHRLAAARWQDRILWILKSLSKADSLALLKKTTYNNNTVLHILAENDQLDLIRSILGNIDYSRYLLLLSIQNSSGDNVLHCMIKGAKRNKGYVEDFLNAMPEEERFTLLTAVNDETLTPVHQAVRNDDIAFTSVLINSVPDKERFSIINIQTVDGSTGLHLAVDRNNLEMTQLVFNSLAEPEKLQILNIKNIHGRTAMELATKRQFLEPMKFLLRFTKSSNRSHSDSDSSLNPSSSMLHIAAMDNKSKSIKGILEDMDDSEKVKMIMQKNEQSKTVLHIAVENNDIDSVKYILNCVKSNEKLQQLLLLQDHDGETAVHLAIHSRLKEILVLLLNTLTLEGKVKALSVKNKRHQTALHLTADKGNLTLTKEIVDSIKDFPHWFTLLNITNGEKETALQAALSRSRNSEVAKYLLNSSNLLNRLAIINGSRPREAIALLNGITFSTPEAEKLAKAPKYKLPNGDTFLHIAAKFDHFTSAKLYLDLLSEEYRLQALTNTNKAGKTTKQITKDPKLQAFLIWAQEQTDVYYLPTPPLLLIMYITKQREPGAEREKAALVESLSSYEFNTVVKKDLTADQMLEQISKSVNQHDDISGLFVVVMAHGQKGAIWAKDDKPVRIQDILIQMNHPALEGKPKALLLQACQGRRNEYITIPNYSDPEAARTYDAPVPCAENMRENEVMQKRLNFARLAAHFCKNYDQATLPELPNATLETLVPNGFISPAHRLQIRYETTQFLTGMRKLDNILTNDGRQDDFALRSSDTDLKHFDVQFPDFVVLCATVNGGVADREGLVPIFADQMQKSDPSDGIYTVFRRTQKEVKAKKTGQILEFRSTMDDRLCFKNTFCWSDDSPEPAPPLKPRKFNILKSSSYSV